MARPKGSKNKKSITRQKRSDPSELVRAEAALRSAETEVAALTEALEQQRVTLAAKKREARRLTREFASLQNRQAAREAAEAAAVRKLQAEQLVATLLADGKTPEEITRLLGT